MKRIAILTSALVCFAAVGTAQISNGVTENSRQKSAKHEKRIEKKELRKQTANAVSYFTKSGFEDKFGHLSDVTWTRTDHFDQATFWKDGLQQTAYYSFDGELIGTSSIKTFAELPPAGQKKIRTQYADYSVVSVLYYQHHKGSNSDQHLYGPQFAHGDNYFVSLQKENRRIILQVNPLGQVFFFKQLK